MIGDKGAAALADAVRATLVFCTQCFSGHDESIYCSSASLMWNTGISSVFHLEMEVLRQVWRAARCGSRGVIYVWRAR